MARKSVHLDMRITPERRREWGEAAAAAGLTLTGWLERIVDERLALERVIARNEAVERERSERFHRGDPVRARRRDWGRSAGGAA